MFISPATTVRFPCHHGGNIKLALSPADEYMVALYELQSQAQFVDAANFAAAAHWLLPPSTQTQLHHPLPLHPRRRAVMSEEAWHQSISDYEDETYFNSPYLQHPEHTRIPPCVDAHQQNLASFGANAALGNAGKGDPQDVSTPDGSYTFAGVMEDDGVADHPMWSNNSNSSNNNHRVSYSPGATALAFANPYWHASSDPANVQGQSGMPGQTSMGMYHGASFDESSSSQSPGNAFGADDIARDIEFLVSGPMSFPGLPGPAGDSLLQQQQQQQQQPYHSISPKEWLQENTQSAMPPHQNMYNNQPPTSPMASLASQDDMSSSEASPFPNPQLPSSSTSPTQKTRKSLPNGPIRSKPCSASSSSSFAAAAPYPQITRASADFEPYPRRSNSPAASARSVSFKLSANRALKGNEDSSPPVVVDDRAAKDDFLVRARNGGMSYKDIKVQGNFTEAESTLRGRYRMLTKSKEERVRNPKWTEVDEMLLRQAVTEACNGRDPATMKLPWKEIAQSIVDNGGSYHFGNATCRKKWDELMMADDEE